MKTLITPRRLIILSILAVLLFLAALPVMAAGTPEINWFVMGSGGGSASAGSYDINSTIGQAVSGLVQDTDMDLCSGFWCRAISYFRALLPVVVKN